MWTGADPAGALLRRPQGFDSVIAGGETCGGAYSISAATWADALAASAARS